LFVPHAFADSSRLYLCRVRQNEVTPRYRKTTAAPIENRGTLRRFQTSSAKGAERKDCEQKKKKCLWPRATRCHHARKGRRSPPIPLLTLRPGFSCDAPGGLRMRRGGTTKPGAAATGCAGVGGGLSPDDAGPKTRRPAIRRRRERPIPRARPMFRVPYRL